MHCKLWGTIHTLNLTHLQQPLVSFTTCWPGAHVTNQSVPWISPSSSAKWENWNSYLSSFSSYGLTTIFSSLYPLCHLLAWIPLLIVRITPWFTLSPSVDLVKLNPQLIQHHLLCVCIWVAECVWRKMHNDVNCSQFIFMTINVKAILVRQTHYIFNASKFIPQSFW